MKLRWVAASRLNEGAAYFRSQQKLTVAAVSEDPKVKLSIEDLTNRIAMPGDVQGRVSLIKRDLAMLMVAAIKVPTSNGCLQQRNQPMSNAPDPH